MTPNSLKLSLLTAACATAVASSLAPTALAQSQPDVRDTVVVTAQQREETLVDVPITITVLDADEISRRGVTDLQNLSYAVPEMITVVTGMAQNRVMLRGIGEGGGNFPLVGIYLDNVAVDGPLRGPVDIRPLDVERVEVLHGPQGTLYGQGSVGGTVRFLTQAPVIGETSLTASADVWTTEDGAMSQRLVGVTNLSLSDQSALRIAGMVENTGGWIDAPTANREDINDGELFQIRATGLFKLTDSLSVTGMAQVHRNDVGSLANGENGNGDLILPAFAPNAVQPAKNDHDLYSLTADWDLGNVKLLAVASSFRNDASGAFYSPFAGTGRFLRFDNRDEAKTGELRLTSSTPGPWKWTLGGYYRDADFNSVTTLYLLGPANGTTSTNVNFVTPLPIKSESWSAYGNTSFDLTDQLQIGGGLRYFNDEQVSPIAGQPGQTFDSLDPRIYATYKLLDGWNIYASAAKGFRSGGFNAVNTAFPASFGPETVWSYEAGTKFETWNGALSGEVAVFTSKYDDMQVSTIATSVGQSYTGNVGKSDVNGLDWSLRLHPTDWLTIGTTGVILDTEVVEVASSSAYIVGDQLNYIPDSNFNLFAETEADLPDNLTVRARIDYNRRGASSFAQRTVNLTANGDVLDLLSARLAFDWGNHGLEIYSENILNDRGQNFPNPVQFATRAVPRSIGLRATASF